mgnify:CR=1 FL=1
MAQKVNPNAFRLGLSVPWSSRWFFKKSMRYFLEEDLLMRTLVREKILQAGIAGIDIERTVNTVRVLIKARRPGLIIGRGGKGIEDLKAYVVRKVKALRVKREIKAPLVLTVTIEELKRNEVSAPVIAQQIAFDLERRQPYRRVMKRYLESIMQNREVKGAKVKLAGRLNGAEMSRHVFLAKGTMPLQTLRASIGYGEATSFNSYGTIGVKVWIYKGEVFKNNKPTSQ